MSERLFSMDKIILSFARDLRRQGVPVCLPEIMDALRGIERVGFAKNRFKTVLQASLIKDQVDAPVFNKLFELYFETYEPGRKTVSGEDISLSKNSPDDFTARLFSSRGQGLTPQLKGTARVRLARAAFSGDRLEITRLARQGVDSVKEELCSRNEPMDAEEGQLDRLLYHAKAALEWFMFTFYLESRRGKSLVEEEEYRVCRHNLRLLEEELRGLLEKQVLADLGEEGLERVLKERNLRRKDFSLLKDWEANAVKQQVVKLGRKMATRRGRRKKPGKRGQVDIKNTVRQAVKTGGIPIKIFSRGRVISQPDLIILCDVSGSVIRFSTFMLLFLYTFQESFRYVRSFLFIDLLAEVTNFFKNSDPAGGIKDALEHAVVSETNNSDFGRVFFSFAAEHLREITPQTILLILGDAKNNWRPDESLAFKKIAHRAKRVYWFNPQPRETWNTRDSVMRVYAPYCDQVLECRNLEQLTRAAGELFRGV